MQIKPKSISENLEAVQQSLTSQTPLRSRNKARLSKYITNHILHIHLNIPYISHTNLINISGSAIPKFIQWYSKQEKAKFQL